MSVSHHVGGVILGCAAVVAMGDFAHAAQAVIEYEGAYYTQRVDRADEPTHKQILEHLYGGTFESAGGHGLDFTNGLIYVKRIADDRDVVVQTAIGQTNGDLYQYTDRVWQDQFSTVHARARFASYGQAFGYVPYDNGLGYNELFRAFYNHEYDMTQSANMPDLNGASFLWARHGENGIWTSEPEQNRDGKDHLITYKVVPVEQPRPVSFSTENDELINHLEVFKTFLLFWEDQTNQGGNLHNYDVGDWDFNDLVVEVRAQYNEIPEPGTALAGVGLLAMLGMRRRRA